MLLQFYHNLFNSLTIPMIPSEIKMAPKVCVPADFGRHHIGAPSHGNLTFNLGEGVKIRANSIILSLNSPVIDELTTNLHQTSLEADDFSREAVDCFVESTYTGEIEAVNLGNFRDVNKMSRVFQVSWLVAKCEEYFVSYLDKLDSESSYSDMLFVVEEAVYLMNAIKSRDLLNLTVKRLASISASKRNDFVKEYLFDLGQASLCKIDACISIVLQDVHIIVKLLATHLRRNGNKSLDENSRHIIKNIDLVTCFDESPDAHAEIFAALESLTEMTIEDLQLFVCLYKSLSIKRPASGIMLPVISHESFKSYLYPSMNIINVFDKLVSKDDIADLYTLIARLWVRLYNIEEKDVALDVNFVQKIVNIVEERGWSPICESYVIALKSDSFTEKFLKAVQSSDDLVSEGSDSSYVTIFEYPQPQFITEVFCKDSVFKFQIPGYGDNDLEFVLSTTAGQKDSPDLFDMQWGLQDKRCGHCLTSFPKLHFALVVTKDGDAWHSVLPISCCGKPTCDESGTYWNWGYIKFHDRSEDKIKELVGHLKGFVNWPFYEEIQSTDIVKMVAFTIE